MDLKYKYRFILSNVSGDNDCHTSGRLTADTVEDAAEVALRFWSFPVPVLEMSLEYCGVVEQRSEPAIADDIDF